MHSRSPKPPSCWPRPSSRCRCFASRGLSSILGYLAAGLVIGPWGLNLIGDIDRIMQVSSSGIVLLLFLSDSSCSRRGCGVMRRVVYRARRRAGGAVRRAARARGPGAGEQPVAAAVIGFGTVDVLDAAGSAGARRARPAQDAVRRAAFGILLVPRISPCCRRSPCCSCSPPATGTQQAGGPWWMGLLKLHGG